MIKGGRSRPAARQRRPVTDSGAVNSLDAHQVEPRNNNNNNNNNNNQLCKQVVNDFQVMHAAPLMIIREWHLLAYAHTIACWPLEGGARTPPPPPLIPCAHCNRLRLIFFRKVVDITQDSSGCTKNRTFVRKFIGNNRTGKCIKIPINLEDKHLRWLQLKSRLVLFV